MAALAHGDHPTDVLRLPEVGDQVQVMTFDRDAGAAVELRAAHPAITGENSMSKFGELTRAGDAARFGAWPRPCLSAVLFASAAVVVNQSGTRYFGTRLRRPHHVSPFTTQNVTTTPEAATARILC